MSTIIFIVILVVLIFVLYRYAFKTDKKLVKAKEDFVKTRYVGPLKDNAEEPADEDMSVWRYLSYSFSLFIRSALYAAGITALPALLMISVDEQIKQSSFRPSTWSGDGAFTQMLNETAKIQSQIEALEFKMQMMITYFVFAFLSYIFIKNFMSYRRRHRK